MIAKRLVVMTRHHPLGVFGAAIIVTFSVLAVIAPWIAPFDPNAMDTDKMLLPPGGEHFLGTDWFGRDIWSRLLYGARTSLLVGITASVLGTSSGAVLGLISGFVGGWIDNLVQRFTDTLMAFPLLVLALAMVAALGASVQNVVLALAVVIMPNATRIVRATVLSVREQPYIEAARSLGLPQWRMLFRHVLPNSLAPLIIIFTGAIGSAILAEATLSFLGLGTPPPDPTWGSMLSGNTQRYMTKAPWLAIFPGLAITILVFGFNYFGDALRDVLDPKNEK